MKSHSGHTPAVLVVEDEILIRMEAVDMFEDAGFRTYQAKSADAALLLLRDKRDIGLLFTDVDMPGSMNGLTLAAHVRRSWPEIRIMIASGIIELKPEDIPAGASLIPKPYPSTVILRQLDGMRGD